MPEVHYSNNKVQKACSDDKTQTKINSLLQSGGHKGTPTKKLKAFHDHVTNSDAIAYVWKGEDLHIVGYGVKGKPKGNQVEDSGYVWVL